MTGIIYKQLINWNRLYILSTAILVLFLLVGCATGGNYGKLDRDSDLNNMFLNYEVLPDYRYYSTGGFYNPSAILAVHRDYELVNSANLWRGTPNVNSAQMREWIDAIAPSPYPRWAEYYAAYILDSNGKRVGAWYSFESFATVKFLGENKIQVYPPNPGPGKHFGSGLRGGGH